MDLSQHFKSTCKILLGSEIGELSEFREWLSEMVLQPALANSAVSGKAVFLARSYYAKDARFFRLGEKENAPALSINEIKDIDSVLSSLSGRFSYCGNKNIGISMNVQESDSCTDCTDVLSSGQMVGDRRAAYSYAMRESECVFGCMWSGEIAFSMRCQGLFFSKRCFDSYLCVRSFDLFSCMNCRASSDLMFSFNQVSKRHLIGNCELQKEKYLALRKKLSAEVAEQLRKGKKYPSLFQLVGELHG
jgi:hypothetical protein